MTKVNVEAIKPWVAKRITELLTLEDDIFIEMVPPPFYSCIVNGLSSLQ